MVKKKKNQKKIVIIISLLVIVWGGFLAFDKLSAGKPQTNNEETVTNNYSFEETPRNPHNLKQGSLENNQPQVDPQTKPKKDPKVYTIDELKGSYSYSKSWETATHIDDHWVYEKGKQTATLTLKANGTATFTCKKKEGSSAWTTIASTSGTWKIKDKTVVYTVSNVKTNKGNTTLPKSETFTIVSKRNLKIAGGSKLVHDGIKMKGKNLKR